MNVKRTIITMGGGLIGVLMAAACQLSSDAGPAITPGQPTTPPLLTPTSVVADPLPDAAYALRIGDYGTAQALYNAAVAGANKCTALYGLGLSQLEAGQAADAEGSLTRALTECPPTVNAYIQRGEARRAQGANRAADALKDYQAALTIQPGVIDSYLYERMSLAASSPTEQFKYLQLAANAPRYLAGTFALREKIAQIVLAANDPANAVNQYDLILSQAINLNYRASVEVEAGNALLALAKNVIAQTPTTAPTTPTVPPTQFNSAYARYRLVINDSSDTPAAIDALINLVNAGQPVDMVLRTKINATHNNFGPVVNYLPDYLQVTPANQIPASLYFWLGQSQRGVGHTSEALNAFQKVRDAYPGDPLASSAALEQGRTQFVVKNYSAAIAAYLACAATYPKSSDAPEALFRAGTIAQNYGDVNQAVTIYDQLGSNYPTSDQAKSGLFDAGLIVSATDPNRAAGFFGRAGDAHGLLWQGKMLLKAGNSAGAKQAWTAADALSPGTFFSLRAHDLLNNVAAYRPAGTIRFPASSDAERTAAENWLRQTFQLAFVSTALSPDLAQDTGLIRATALWRLGWQSEARAEFDALQTAKRDDPLASYQLAVYENGIGDYSAGLIAATRLINLSKQPAATIPAYLARIAYPVPFTDTLVAAAHEFKVDPLYFSALIRLESNFDPLAISGSDARGLTQIVPATAQDIVGRLGWPANFTVSDLYRPQIGLRLGAYYVDFVRRYIGDYPAAILAGYNAGPGNAKNWVQTAGADVDLLYETIGASDNSQAQAYIRYTYEFDDVYRRLYGG